MSTNSKIGKVTASRDFLKSVPDSELLIEAAMRRGQSMSKLIEPSSPSLITVDLKRWKQAMFSATNVDHPDMNAMYDVYENIRIDNSLTSNIDTTILKVQQAKFNLIDKAGKPNAEAKKLLERQWFLDFLKIAMESRYEGFRLGEAFYFNDVGELAEFKCVDKYHVKARQAIVTKYPYDEEGQSYLEPPLSLFYIPMGDPTDMGILHKVAPIVLAKKYAIAHWGEFNEKMGIPFRTVTTNASNTKRQEQLGIIMDKMGSAGWAVLHENEKVELMDMAGSDPTRCFEGLINLLNSERAMLIMGQSSTSNSDSNKGTYGSMAILQDISNDRHEANLTYIKYLFNDSLLPRLIQLSPAYKIFEGLTLDWDKSVDLKVNEVVDYVVKLSDVYNIPAEWVTQKTGIPIEGIKTTDPALKPVPVPKKKSPVANIAAIYKPCCSHQLNITAAATPDFEPDFNRIARELFDAKHNGKIDMAVITKTANYLQAAITGNYGKPVDAIDRQMLASLKNNVWVFSGFKTYQTLKEASSKLIDEKGNTRSFSEFKTEVLKLNEKYNGTYLKAEYDHAIVGSQMASQWQDIQRNKETLPYLKFVATEDARTTAICRSLDGTTLPVDDPFWSEHYLPLHWHERSLIQQVASGTITPASTVKDLVKLTSDEIKPMFKQNIGKEGVLFPDNHPYFDTNAKDRAAVKEAATVARIRETRETVKQWSKKNIDELKGTNYKVATAEFDVINLRRGDVRVITSKPHAQAADAYMAIMDMKALFSESKYLGWSSDVKKKLLGNYHQDVDKWLYYEVSIADEISYLNVMFTKGEYRLHSISDKGAFSKRKVQNKAKK